MYMMSHISDIFWDILQKKKKTEKDANVFKISETFPDCFLDSLCQFIYPHAVFDIFCCM